jgi:2-dehydro-3-deoxyphosphogluconate aldolase/(4S)-4-hydroxy-2-oxoglutarate aldolase
LLAPAASGDFDKITEVAKQYAAKLKEIRGK